MSDEFFARDSRQPGHFWADNEVLDIYAPLLGAHGFAVYMALTRNATNGTGECKLSTSKLAAQLGISKGGVFNALGLLVKLNLAKRIHAGDPRHPAIYILADVKALVNPTYAQLRLAPSVHPVNAKGHPVNAKGHPVNAAFTPRTRNKEVKTSLQDYKTKTEGEEAPPAKFSQSDFDERDLRKIGAAKKKLNEWIESHPSSGQGMSNGDYYMRIAEEAGVTIKRILELEKVQRQWPESKEASA